MGTDNRTAAPERGCAVTHKEVIVVGGGIAGLTAALSLAHKGKDVLLVEKNDYCGGLMNSFVRDGFRFEGGARALVNAGLVKTPDKGIRARYRNLAQPDHPWELKTPCSPIDGEQSLDATTPGCSKRFTQGARMRSIKSSRRSATSWRI